MQYQCVSDSIPPLQLCCDALPPAALRILMRASPARIGPHASLIALRRCGSLRCALPSALCRTIVSLPSALCSISALMGTLGIFGRADRVSSARARR